MSLCSALLAAVLLYCQMSTMRGDETSVSESINQFSMALYRELSAGQDNLVVSPFSVSAVVSMLWMGMGGDTKTHVAQALYLPTSRSLVAEGFKTLLTSEESSNDNVLELANRIYIQNDFPLKDEFRNDTRYYFHSEAEEVDFAQKTEEVRTHINKWVANKTHEKIKELLKPGSLSSGTIIALLNAIYFKGLWKIPFVKSDTVDSAFHLISGSEKTVPMMFLEEDLLYTELRDLNTQVLKLPYKGYEYSMLIFLPRETNGITNLESNLNNLNISQVLRNLESFKVTVKLPRFKIRSKIDLVEPLKKLGMSELFSSGANLSGVSDGDLSIGKALQEACIEVNEEGTEAAAATVILAVGSSFNPDQRYETFNANHPFLYVILDEGNGTVIFMGRVMNPEE